MQSNPNPVFLNINIQSLNSKHEKLSNFILSLTNKNIQVDLIAIQETWKIPNLSLVAIPGFQPFIAVNRKVGKGGGVGFYIRNGINFSILNHLSPFEDKLFESLTLELSYSTNNHKKSFIVSNIYRSPSPIPNLTPTQQIESFLDKLDSHLLNLSARNLDTFIFTDSNINLLNLPTDETVRLYFNSITERGFTLTNLKATRIQGNSSTLIDHIITNSKAHSLISGSIIDDLSDHFITFLSPKIGKVKSKPQLITRRILSTSNITNFKTALNDTNWDEVLSTTDVDTCYSCFWEKYSTLYNLHFPIVKSKFNKNLHKISNFMTKGLLNSRSHKLNLQKGTILNPSTLNLQYYRNYRNMYNKLVRISKKMHYTNTLNSHANNPKKTWETLKELTTGKHTQSKISKITANNATLEDPQLIAEEFNSFFTGIGSTIANSVEPTLKTFADYLTPPNANAPSLSFSPITHSQLISTINSMAAKSSTDISGISTKMIKQIKFEIAQPLLHLFNLSLTSGTFPSQLKTSRTIPIFKTGDSTSCDNYRPISLLSSISKILEKIIANRLVNHLETNNLLYEHQYGFQQGKSTVHSMLQLTNYIAKQLNEKKYVVGVFLDLKKAFDVVSHDILLAKLKNLGVNGVELKWFTSYLADRVQCVDIEGCLSSNKTIDISVLQGSILGPILFLCFINDLPSITDLITYLFADDTAGLDSDLDLDRLINRVNSEINKLANWFRANKMAVNVGKTKYIIFRPKGKQINSIGDGIVFNNNEIGQTQDPDKIWKLERVHNNNPDKLNRTYKLLGIYLDEYLSFDTHCDSVCAKISQSNYIINRSKNFLNTQSLKTLYFSLVHPHLLYCLPIYSCTSLSNIAKLEKAQKKAIRTITRSPRNAPCTQLFNHLKILPLKKLITHSQCLLTHSIIHKYAPASLHNTWVTNNSIRNDHLLRNGNDLYTPLARTDQVKKLPFFLFPKTWNELPEFKLIPSKTSFKTALKSFLQPTTPLPLIQPQIQP